MGGRKGEGEGGSCSWSYGKGEGGGKSEGEGRSCRVAWWRVGSGGGSSSTWSGMRGGELFRICWLICAMYLFCWLGFALSSAPGSVGLLPVPALLGC